MRAFSYSNMNLLRRIFIFQYYASYIDIEHEVFIVQYDEIILLLSAKRLYFNMTLVILKDFVKNITMKLFYFFQKEC